MNIGTIHTIPGKDVFCKVSLLSLALSLALTSLMAKADDGDAKLMGSVAHSEKVSGYRGTKRTLKVDNDLHGIYSVASAERKNNPCWVRIGTENINDTSRDGTAKNLCGGKATSRNLKAQYRDNMLYGERVFVTGIRVCTNKKETRVKGFQLRGKQVLEDGVLGALELPEPDEDQVVTSYSYLKGGGGKIEFFEDRKKWQNDPENPADWRNNCKEWHKWANCPSSDQIATGIVGHFDAGKKPRALTGIELMCRKVANATAVGATRAP